MESGVTPVYGVLGYESAGVHLVAALEGRTKWWRCMSI